MSASASRTRIEALSEKIKRKAEKLGKPARLMEVCGTHTMAIFRHGLRSLLPDAIKLISGPGCPVCVTSAGDVEAAVELARNDNVALATFGDMMRTPGRKLSLAQARAEGADVRVVYSPLDALTIAKENKCKEVVFFGVGFETTSPLTAATLDAAVRQNIKNFSVFSVHKLVPPALEALMGMGDVRVDGFILPGHVSAVIGSDPYEFLARRHHRPCVVAGFDAEDILSAILMLLDQLISAAPRVQIQYSRVVERQGNPKALSMMNEFFEPEDSFWRGIGKIPSSGLGFKTRFSEFDAASRFNLLRKQPPNPLACECGEVLKGVKNPNDCKLFGKKCKPETPVGPCMVSSEGSCAAYYKYLGS